MLRRHLLAAAVVGVSTAYVIAVNPGLPYDEPAHWANVVYIAHHGTPPVLGRNASYEAQMGPVAYYGFAAVTRTATALHAGTSTGFYACRLLGIPLLLALFVLTRRLVAQATSLSPLAVTTGAAVATLNPMVVAMSTSIQNDTLALVLALLSLSLVADDSPSTRRAAVAGAVAGLAVLTKLTAWPVAPAIVIWLVARRRPRAALASMAAAVTVSGWWFLRNLSLYGDLTGQQGVSGAGYRFGPGDVHVVHLAKLSVSYLWLPTEYFRNTISAPSALQLLLALLTIALLFLGAVKARRRPPSDVLRMLAGVAIAAYLAWLVTYAAVQAVAPRVAYVALAGWAAMVALAFADRERSAAWLVGLGLLGLHVGTVVAVSRVGYTGLQL